MRADNIPINDIIVPIDISISPWLYLILIVLMMAAVFGIVNWKRWKAKEADQPHTLKLCYQTLRSVDVNDTKKAAYEISMLGYALIQENPELTESYKRLNKFMEPYKYALEVKPFSPQAVAEYETFCREVYEKIS